MSNFARTCPDCVAPLDVVRHEGVELDRCPLGHGLWLDRGELRAVVASEQRDRPVTQERAAITHAAGVPGRAIVEEAAKPRRACPICGAAMRLVEYANSNIVIDECVEHGIWLDGDELEQIEAYAEGMRRQSQLAGRDGRSAVPVRGIDVPEHLLATIRSAAVPRPGS